MTPLLTVAGLSIMLFMGSGLLMPFAACIDRWQAYVSQRALYEKCAMQTERLFAGIIIFSAGAILADFFAGGFIDNAARRVWELGWIFLCCLYAVAAVLSASILFAKKSAARWIETLLCIVASILFCAVLVFFLFWTVSRTGTVAVENGAILEQCRMYFGDAAVTKLVCSAAFLLTSATALAFLVSLCWHIICRARNDFGRDFYTLVLNRRARQAFAAVLSAFVFSLFLLFLHPSLRDGWTGAFIENAGELENLVLNSLLVLLPIAAWLCRIMFRHALPLQKRSYAFMALIAFYFGCIVSWMHC